MEEMITMERARELILERIRPFEEVEYVMLPNALGRILAENQVAKLDNPPFDRAPVDGYACKGADLAGASPDCPVCLRVLEEIDAGQYSDVQVKSGEAVRIMTGAAIPSGCDCCVRQEVTDCGEVTAQVYEPVQAGDNYCYAGEDYKKGTFLLEKGTHISYVEAGILASMGCRKVPVMRRPRIALFTTGDEVVSPGEVLLPGKIYNSNGTMLEFRLKELGMEPTEVDTVKDDPEALAKRIRDVSGHVDLIVTTGGVSVGKKDIVHDAVKLLDAEKVFWRIKMKPGTPVVFSVCDNVPVISLSGNPFAALVNFELLVRPALGALTGNEFLNPVWTKAVMADPFPKESKGRRLIRGILRDGKVYLNSGLHSSGCISTMRNCNCLVDICPGTELLQPGDVVSVIIL